MSPWSSWMSSTSQHLPPKTSAATNSHPVTAQGWGWVVPLISGVLPSPNISWGFFKPKKGRSEPWGPAAGPTLAPALVKKLTSRNKGFPPDLRVWSGAMWGLQGEIRSSRGWVVPSGRHSGMWMNHPWRHQLSSQGAQINKEPKSAPKVLL